MATTETKSEAMIPKGYRLPKHHIKNMAAEQKQTGDCPSEIIRDALDQRYRKKVSKK